MNHTQSSKSRRKFSSSLWVALPFLFLALFSVSCVGTRGMGVDVKVYQEESILLTPLATEPEALGAESVEKGEED